MPYSSMDEVNPAIKGIKPPVSLAQANKIAEWADAMEKSEDPPESPWAAAIAQFKRLYEVTDGKWVKKQDAAGSAVDVTARSFDETRRLVDAAITKRLRPEPETNDAPVPYPWVYDLGPNAAVVSFDGQMYAIPYTIAEDGTVLLGEMSVVTSQWVRQDGTPILLHAMDVRLGDGDEADEDDGLIWKELIHPGAWFKMDSGKRVEVTAEIIAEVYRAFSAGLPKYVSVPTDDHHFEKSGDVPVEANRGFVRKLKLIDDRLFGGFDLLSEDVRAGVADGSIADCSVYIQANVKHPATGEQFDWVLRHVLLTNNPLVQDLEGWNTIPAAGSNTIGAIIVHYKRAQAKKEGVMPQEHKGADIEDKADTIMLTGDAKEEYAKLTGLGLTADEIAELIKNRDAIAARAQDLRTKARDMETMRIVKALEGADEHAGVVQIAGTRHYPVVIEAVKKVLDEAPTALAMAADDNGVSGVDAVVLSIVNAIPADGRVSVEQPAGRKDAPAVAAGAADEVTETQVDQLIDDLKL